MSSRDAYIEYTRRFFLRWLPVYDLFARSIFFAYDAAVRRIDPRPGRTVLDLCTGTGEIALRCAQRGADVMGVDITDAMLDKACLKTRGLGVRLRKMDARRLDFAENAFDVVVLSFALHDMPRKVRGQVLAEAARVGRERIVILDYDFPARGWLRRPLVRVIRLFETAYLERFAAHGVRPLLDEAGLRDVRVTRLGPVFSVWRVGLGYGSSSSSKVEAAS